MSQKRVCLLTGAPGKLGTAFCKAAADEYRIVAVYRRFPPAVPSQLRQDFDPLAIASGTEESESVYAIKADLTQEFDRRRVVELALARFGRIDLLVNGAVHSVWAPLIESNRALDTAAAQFHMNTMVPAHLAVLCARLFWRDKVADNRRHNRNVINMSSIAGSRVYPGRGQSIYAASKAALDHLSRHLAAEMQALGIRVNSLAPNTFQTIVPIENVVNAIKRMDRGDLTGKVVLIDRDGETLT